MRSVVEAGAMRKLVWAVPPLLILAVVGWTRILPLQLHGAETWADRTVRAQVRGRVLQEARGARLEPAEVDRRIETWIERNSLQFRADRDKLAATFRAGWRYTGEDGREHVYLSDHDSYTWARLARNYLRTGTTCDAVVDGECRDMFVNGTVGTRLVYDRSLHIATIAWLHRLITLVRPEYPLTSTAFWIPVLVGTLCVVPAFAIGRRLAGRVGAVAAGLLVPLHPVLLLRSIGSDNDVWNVALPLFMVWAVLAALDARTLVWRVVWAVVAAGVAALHAVTWSGWLFGYVATLIAIGAGVMLHAGAAVIGVGRPPTPTPGRARRGAGTPEALPPPRWEMSRALAGATVLAAFVLAVSAFNVLAGVEPWWTRLPLPGVQWAATATPTIDPDAKVRLGVWPNTLATVAELQATDLSAIEKNAYGLPYLVVAALGLLAVWLPTARWRRGQLALAVGASIAVALLFWKGHVTRDRFVLSLVALVAAGVVSDLLGGGAQRARWYAALLLAVWFGAAAQSAFSGDRFLLLLVPGVGLAMAAAVGRVCEVAANAVARRLPRRATLARWVVGALGVVAILPATRTGVTASRDYVPSMNDAWWDTLTELRERSAPDAIVNTWWDYGYWVKYGAERRVTADGATLLTHLPYWLGRVMVSASETEAVGLLRMLNCGSDASPLPDGESGAYAKLLAKLNDAVAAQATLIELVRRDRAGARALLVERGYTPAEQDTILAATHCDPPESYLVISQELTAKDAWMRMGAWDFMRAYIADEAARLPQADAVADFVKRFGLSQPEAERLYAQARSTPRSDFVIGPAPRAPSVWFPCRPAPPGAAGMLCRLGLFDKASNNIIDELQVDIVDPARSRLRYRPVGPGGRAGAVTQVAPDAVVVAGDRLEERAVTGPRYPGVAVLLDTVNARVLVAPPLFVRSLFAHLLFLDGRYATRFEKVGDHKALRDDRVVTWKVHF